jgi:hypothetical protein
LIFSGQWVLCFGIARHRQNAPRDRARPRGHRRWIGCGVFLRVMAFSIVATSFTLPLGTAVYTLR